MAGFDLNALFQQAQQIQEQMKRAQEELARKEVTGTAGGGMVTVTANGRGELLKVQIDPKVVDPKDVAMLEDLVLAAVNSALRAALSDPVLREKLKELGTLPFPDNELTPEAHARLFASDMPRVAKLVESSGIKASEAK